MDGEWPFDDAAGNGAWARLFKYWLNKLLPAVTFTDINADNIDTEDLQVTGDATLAVAKVGQLEVDTVGADTIAGIATLVAGTATVATTKVRTGSIIQLTPNGAGAGIINRGAIVNGTSFVIASSNGADARTVNWTIFNPIT